LTRNAGFYFLLDDKKIIGSIRFRFYLNVKLEEEGGHIGYDIRLSERGFGLLVEQYLAFAETMALQHTPMYMKNWIERLDNILQMNGRELLTNPGKLGKYSG